MRPQFTRYPGWVIRYAVATVALTACSSDYTAPVASEPSIPSISITFLPDRESAFTVQGDSWTWPGVTIYRSGGYTGTVTLTIEGLPPKVSATFDPSSLDASHWKSEVTFTAEADAPLVEAYVTIRASGDGVADAKTVFRFAVAPPEPSTPSIRVTFLPDGEFAFTVQGDSWTWPGVTIYRSGGYTGTVTLTIEGLPTNVTASFDPSVLDARTTKSEVTFTAEADAPLVEAYVTIRASGDGVADANTVFRFAVGPPARG